MQLEKIKWRYTAIAYVKIDETDVNEIELERSTDQVWREFVVDFVFCVLIEIRCGREDR